MYQTVGYFARRFLTQQASQHQDTLAVRSDVHEIKAALPQLGFRISRLELATIIAGAVGAVYAWKHREPGNL